MLHVTTKQLRTHLGLMALLLLLGSCPPLALAADDQPSALEEITVMAQRRAENAQDVPIAITALGANDLDRFGIRQAGDIAVTVPNLILSSPYGVEAQPFFALRGVTTNDFSQNQGSPIAMYVDEVYRSVGAVQALQTYDLDRVEVLRGPQGTLYGKNATGGAISVYSRNPSLDAYDGYVTLGGGNYNGRTVQAAIGGPIINEALGWRAAVYYNKRDGWLDSIVPGIEPLNGVDALAARLSFLGKPMDNLTILFKVSTSRSRGTPFGVIPGNVDPSITGVNPTLGPFQNAAIMSIPKTIDNDDVSLKIDWNISDHLTLTSVTGWNYGKWIEVSDDGSIGIAIYGPPDTYASTVHALSQEFRLASHDTGAFSWLAGLYYGEDDVRPWAEYHYFDAYPGSFVTADGTTLYGFDQRNYFRQVRESKAAFLNANFDVTSAVTLHGGIRYTRDALSIHDFYALEGGLAAPGPPVLDSPVLWTQTIPVLPGSFTDFTLGRDPKGPTYPEMSNSTSNVSFKVGADYKPREQMLLYASISQGYRGASFNGQAFNSPLELTFTKPEKLTDYEVGMKSEFLQRRLQVNAALFYYDYRDQQFLDQFNSTTGVLYRTINAPKSRIYGAELEMTARPIEDLQIHANVGLLDTKYVDLTLRGTDLSGNQLILAPKTDIGGSVDWRFARLFNGSESLRLDSNYTSKRYFDAFNRERVAQKGYAVTNGRLTYETGNSPQYQVAAWVKNIFNREYLANAIPTAIPADGGLGLDYEVPGEPRTYGVEATVRF
jgi:iron complex outermembrane receptor protein